MYLPTPQFTGGKGESNGQPMNNTNFVQFPLLGLPPQLHQEMPKVQQFQQLMFRNQQQMAPQYHTPPLQHPMHVQPLQIPQQHLRYPQQLLSQHLPQSQQVQPLQQLPHLLQQQHHLQQQHLQAQQLAQQQAQHQQLHQQQQQQQHQQALQHLQAQHQLQQHQLEQQAKAKSVSSRIPDITSIILTTQKTQDGLTGAPEVKRKRGRPKKLILDPTTNLYIDSQHPNFKQLNKLLRENESRAASPPNNTIQQHAPPNEEEMNKLFDKPTYLRTLGDGAVQDLLQKKDRRGRPRKFPVEQTGLTIKGIRVNGTMKQRRKKDEELFHSQLGRVAKRERGRPKKVQQDAVLNMNPELKDGGDLSGLERSMYS